MQSEPKDMLLEVLQGIRSDVAAVRSEVAEVRQIGIDTAREVASLSGAVSQVTHQVAQVQSDLRREVDERVTQVRAERESRKHADADLDHQIDAERAERQRAIEDERTAWRNAIADERAEIDKAAERRQARLWQVLGAVIAATAVVVTIVTWVIDHLQTP